MTQQFNTGDKVWVVAKHTLGGMGGFNECEVGDSGVIEQPSPSPSFPSAYRVTLDNGTRISIDAVCLSGVEPNPKPKKGDRVTLVHKNGDRAEVRVVGTHSNGTELESETNFFEVDLDEWSVVSVEPGNIEEPTETFTVVQGVYLGSTRKFWGMLHPDGYWHHEDDDVSNWEEFVSYLEQGTVQVVSKPVE